MGNASNWNYFENEDNIKVEKDKKKTVSSVFEVTLPVLKPLDAKKRLG